MKKDQTNRRKFIQTGFLAGLGLVSSQSACVNDEKKESGKKVKLISQDGKVVEVSEIHLKPSSHHIHIQPGVKDKSFVMVIDLSRCKNEKKCQTACNKAHFITRDQPWVKIYPMKDSRHAAPYWQPTICVHCDNPPCVKVCPVEATYKREDGVVLIDNKRCIGCRFCMAACPYSARTFNWSRPEVSERVGNMEYAPETSVPPQLGTVEKCDFCADMVRDNMLPHCVNSCPNGVFFFGDLNEDVVTNGAETYRFSKLIKEKAGYRLMEELGTEPRVYYLPPANRIFEFEEGLENENGSET